MGEARRSTSDAPLVPLLVGEGRSPGGCVYCVEAALGDLDEDEVGGDHPDQDEEEAERQRGEAEEVGEWCERQGGTHDRAGDRGDDHWDAWSAPDEGNP